MVYYTKQQIKAWLKAARGRKIRWVSHGNEYSWSMPTGEIYCNDFNKFSIRAIDSDLQKNMYEFYTVFDNSYIKNPISYLEIEGLGWVDPAKLVIESFLPKTEEEYYIWLSGDRDI